MSVSTTPLLLLLVEDSDDDAALLLRELRRGGFDVTVTRVETRDAFLAALGSRAWDVIISDYALPTYSGLGALRDAREKNIDVPFILVSGTIGETVAVEAMRAGAQDYVMKNYLERLPLAIARELREAKNRAERARMREQLILSERMASAGTLAAGVAHEINNPLTVVMANLDYVAGRLEEVSEPDFAGVAEPLRDAREAAERIRGIVRDVKLFSRPHEGERDFVDVEAVIESSIRMAWNEIRHRARLVREYGKVPAVRVNEARLGQVILNLIVNSAQAIPEGHASANEIRVATKTSEDGEVLIELADTGCGIPPENLRRIFDAFFTTKPVGVGTGLGLAICQRIVTDMGGTIDVRSQVGKGTTFEVRLPRGGEEPERAKTPSRAPVPTRRARVLVVDDEEALARAIERRLVKDHDVTATSSAAEAIARVARGERFDVILADLMMPEISGMQLHAEVARLDREQARRIVFMTGGAFTDGARAFLAGLPNTHMDKPVEPTRLLSIIAEHAR